MSTKPMDAVLEAGIVQVPSSGAAALPLPSTSPSPPAAIPSTSPTYPTPSTFPTCKLRRNSPLVDAGITRKSRSHLEPIHGNEILLHIPGKPEKQWKTKQNKSKVRVSCSQCNNRDTREKQT